MTSSATHRRKHIEQREESVALLRAGGVRRIKVGAYVGGGERGRRNGTLRLWRSISVWTPRILILIRSRDSAQGTTPFPYLRGTHERAGVPGYR